MHYSPCIVEDFMDLSVIYDINKYFMTSNKIEVHEIANNKWIK